MNDKQPAIDRLADKVDKLQRGIMAELNAMLFPYPGARDQVMKDLNALIDSPHHHKITPCQEPDSERQRNRTP